MEHAQMKDWGITEPPELKENKGEKSGKEEGDQDDEEAYQEDFADIFGQEAAKRAAVIAAAGFHNILFIGTKGAGKDDDRQQAPIYLSRPLEEEERMELSRIYSVAGAFGKAKIYDTDKTFSESPSYSHSKSPGRRRGVPSSGRNYLGP